MEVIKHLDQREIRLNWIRDKHGPHSLPCVTDAGIPSVVDLVSFGEIQSSTSAKLGDELSRPTRPLAASVIEIVNILLLGDLKSGLPRLRLLQDRRLQGAKKPSFVLHFRLDQDVCCCRSVSFALRVTTSPFQFVSLLAKLSAQLMNPRGI